MVKVIQADPPPEWLPLWEKIMRWFQIWGIPIFARNWFKTSRREKTRRAKQSLISPMRKDWLTLAPETKTLWKQTAYKATGYYRGYTYFTSDWIYRYGVGLSLPGSPSLFHALFGLKIDNPGGLINIFSQIQQKDYVGKIKVNFSFKKIERTASPTKAFKVVTTCYYFSAGGIASDIDSYVAPAGNVDYVTIERIIGTTNRQYFHIIVSFEIDSYDAEVYLDNLILRDKSGLRFRENWDTIRYEAWEPVMLYRKEGWSFGPAYALPYFIHCYLE